MKKVVTGIRTVVLTLLKKARAEGVVGSAGFESQLLKELDARLKNVEIDKYKLHQAFLSEQINLIGVIARSLSPDFPWHSPCQQYMPDYPGVELYPGEICENPLGEFERLDHLFECALVVSAEKSGSDAGQATAKAEIFAAVLSSTHSMAYLCASRLMRDCAGAWLANLESQPQPTSIACTSLLYKRFQDMHLYKPQEQFFPVVADGIMYYGRLMCTHRLEVVEQTKFGSDTDTLKKAARFIGLCSSDCAGLSRMAYESGNRYQFHATIDSVFEQPNVFASTLFECGVSHEEMLEAFRYCLKSWVFWMPADAIDVHVTKKFVDEHRSMLKQNGYPDVIGTKALDALAAHLELGESFESLSYLRREDMGLGTSFAASHAGKTYSGGVTEAVVPDEILRRKVDLAVRLGQRELLMQAADQMFSGHRPTNKDLSTATAVACLIEHGMFKPSEILRTKSRINLAIEWGLGQVICQDPALKKYAAKAFTYDLGV